MKAPKTPDNEADRIKALKEYNIFDTMGGGGL